ncbi:MAG: hypothetical protein ACI39N_05105 [Lachnospiraceae bacterium]
MNQRIKISRAAMYVIFAMALIAFLAIWPGGLIKKTAVSKSNEVVATESEAVNVEHNVTQMFVAQGTTLGSVDLYVCNQMQGETITFRLYDASYTELFNVFYEVKENEELPGFVHIPVGYDLIVDQEYYYTLEGLSADLYVNYEDTYESTSVANGIMSYAGEEVPGYNVIIRYNYTSAFSLLERLLAGMTLAIVAGLLAFLIKLLFGKGILKDKEVQIQTVEKVVLTPVIAVVTILTILCIFPGRKFGTGAVNYAFYGISVLMLAAFLLYLIYRKRGNESRLLDKNEFIKRIPHYLQTICFAGLLWSCFEYMNGLYEIHHSYAVAKILIWFFLSVIATFDKKEILHFGNLLWLIAGSIWAYLQAKPYIGVEEQGELHKLYAYVIIVGGFVLLNTLLTIIRLIRKKETGKQPNLLFSLLYTALFVFLIVFRNTRTWPILIAVMIGIFAFRMSVWKQSDKLMENFCNGIILNFLLMVLFSLWHRPFHYYIYYRYNMIYHTVTMTAVHISLAMAAVFVKVCAKYQKTGKVKEILPELFLFGMTSSYLIFTLSRTGYLSAGLMMLLMLIVITVLTEKKHTRMKGFLKRTAFLLAAVIYAFPITFTITRMIPSLIKDPVIYEIEPRSISIVKGTPSDSDLYIDIERFVKVFGSKVLGVGEDITGNSQATLQTEDAEELLLASADTEELFILTGEEWYLADAGGEIQPEEEDERDISNGRIDIFREYIKAWNLTGHDEMGVPLLDGTISTHAHSIFLQVIHDHGIITGIYFVLFMGISVFLSIRNLKENRDRDFYQCLIPAVLVGFLTAGLVEWIFHPCNPFGMSVFIVLIPLLFRKVKRC